MKRRIAILLMALILVSHHAFAAGEMSGLTVFPNVMMDASADQLNEATDLTITENNRAILAAMLTLEYCNYAGTTAIVFSQPIFVGKKDTTASCAFAVGNDYIVVFFQMHPTSTSYGKIYDCNAGMARITMEMASDEVWPVGYDLYMEKLEAVVEQLS